jgi:hypothetical protein
LAKLSLIIALIGALDNMIGQTIREWCDFGSLALRRSIERNFAGSELGCPPDTRHRGNDHYRADKNASDLYAVGVHAPQSISSLELKHVEHFEDDDDNDNDANDVEDVSVHGSWITRRYPRRQAI